DLLITTEKDAVRIPPRGADFPTWALGVRLMLDEGVERWSATLDRRVDEALARSGGSARRRGADGARAVAPEVEPWFPAARPARASTWRCSAPTRSRRASSRGWPARGGASATRGTDGDRS